MKDVEDRIKNIVPSQSYDFLKIAIHLYLQYTQKLKIALNPKIAFMNLLEETTQLTDLKLGLYLLWVNIYRIGLGIWEILFFSDFMGNELPKNGSHIEFLSFQGLKNLKKVKFLESPNQICRYSPNENINQASEL